MEEEAVRVNILRYLPESKTKRIDVFRVPYSRGMTVQMLLRHIYQNIDPTFAFRDFRCGKGICNTCFVKLNGRVLKSCESLVHPGEEILIEPANDRVIKDLVVRDPD